MSRAMARGVWIAALAWGMLSPSILRAKKIKKKPAPIRCDKKICATYRFSARGKASVGCGLRVYRGNCRCQKTAQVCGKNWRGKARHRYHCHCKKRCTQRICTSQLAQAKADSAWKCGKRYGYQARRCHCTKATYCGTVGGKKRYNYDCRCK